MGYRNLDSSSIAAVDYEPSSATFLLRFRNGAEYHYSQVPREVYEGLLAAPSAGRYFHEHLRNAGYPFRRVRE